MQKRLVTVTRLGLLSIGLMAAIAGISSFQSNDSPSSAQQVGLDEQVEFDEISLMMTDFESDLVESSLSFEVKLSDRIASDEQVTVPLTLWPSNTKTHNLNEHPQGNFTRTDGHQAGDRNYRFEFVTGPIVDSDEEVAIEFDMFSILYGERQEDIEANVRFEVPASIVSHELTAFESKNVHKSVVDNQIELAVHRVEYSSGAIVVDYTVESQRDGQITSAEQIAWLRRDTETRIDGHHAAMVPSAQSEVLLDSHAAVDARSSFDDADGNELNAGFVFDVGPFVDLSAHGPSEFTIHEPFGNWTATPFEAHGDRFEISNVTSKVHGDTADIHVEVQNVESVDQADVMLQSVTGPAPVAITGDGSKHMATGYGTGMQRDGEEMGAGVSNFVFTDVDSETDSLTIRLSESSEVLRGDWSIELSEQ